MMEKLLKALWVMILLCVMPSSIWAVERDAADFFKTHPNAIDVVEKDGSILFANRQVGLEFRKSATGFELARLYGISENQDFLIPARDDEIRDLFEIRMADDPRRVAKDERHTVKPGGMATIERMATMGNAFYIGSQSAKSVSWREEKIEGQTNLRLEWKGIDVKAEKGMLNMTVIVTLLEGDPLSYWRFNLINPSNSYGIERVRLPILPLSPIGEAKKNVFIYT